MSTEGFEDIKPEASDLEIYRLKTEISALNKSVQHGTDLNHDDIERKVLENEDRIHELEKGSVTPAESTPTTPEPTPTVPPTPEVIPLAPTVTPEVLPPAPPTPEATPLDKYRFSSANRSLWEKMTEKGKGIANKFYEEIKNIPIANETIGKLQIWYNQEKANGYENKMANLKSKMDGLDTRIKSIETFQADARKMIKKGVPGAEDLEIKIREMEQKKVKLQGQKDKKQSRFETRDNSRKLHMEKRDSVADRLIKLYESKLDPVENKLSAVSEMFNQIELDIAVTEAKHQNRRKKLAEIEKSKTRIEESLRATGESERKIKNFETIKLLNEQIAREVAEMKTEKETLNNTKTKVKEKIASIDKKANPLRDKREEYVRIKNTRGANLKVDVRTRSVNLKAEETISGNPRVDAELPSTIETEVNEPTLELNEVVESKKNAETYISIWNEAINENGGDKIKQIDLSDFIKTTKLSNDEKLDLPNFKNILTRYYQKNKMPLGTFIQDMKKFEEKLTK